MPNEPDRYDLDEMMDRLKRRTHSESEDKGELVTRADGSQAIKVRRHKRRSRQPHKERIRRLRILQLSAVLVLLLFILLAAGFVTIYVNTAPFRNQLISKVAVVSGAEAKLQQFRMNPTGANAQGIDMEWPAGNAMESLSLRGLHADVSPFAVLAGKFSGKELTAHTGKLVLRHPDSEQPSRVKPKQAGEQPLHFTQCSVNSMEIVCMGPKGDSFRLTDSEASFKPTEGDQPSLLRMTRGDLRSTHWPLLRLDRAYIELTHGQIEIVGASFMHADDDRGLIEVSGPLSVYPIQATDSLKLKVDSFLLSGVLGDSMSRIFEGRVDSVPDSGLSKLELRLGEQASARLSMDFQSTLDEPMVVQNLPVLFALSQILGDEWFSKPIFPDGARGRLIREDQRIELSELELVSENRMALRGRICCDSGVLSGKLEVGLAAGMIQASENRTVDKMFGELSKGYRWIELEIGGSPVRPEDNFSKLYEKALEQLRQPAVSTPNGGGGSFDELTRPR